jgi:hypothetical protein
LRTELWGSQLFHGEKCQGENLCDERRNNNNNNIHSNQQYAALRLEALIFPGIIHSPPSVQSDASSQFHTFHVPCINQMYTNLKKKKKCTWIYKCDFQVHFLTFRNFHAFHCSVQKSPCLIAILSHINPADTPPPHPFKSSSFSLCPHNSRFPSPIATIILCEIPVYSTCAVFLSVVSYFV